MFNLVKSATIYTHLDEYESIALINFLKMQGVKSYRRRMGNGLYRNMNYTYFVYVAKDDYQKASKLAEMMKPGFGIMADRKKMICNTCNSKPPNTQLTNELNLWERLMSFGAKKVVCDQCGFKWFV